jgi:hypothetical protein
MFRDDLPGGALERRQILAQNLIYFMNFVDFYQWSEVA